MNKCNTCDPCETLYSPGGCADSVSSGCVPYNGPALSCLNIGPKDTVNTIIKKLVDAVCALNEAVNGTTPTPVCPNLSNVVATKTGVGTASVSFLTNNSSGIFKYAVDGGSTTLITSNPFTINGLSSAQHTITIRAYLTSNGSSCANDDASVDMTEVSQITAYWGAQNTSTLPTSQEILALPLNGHFNSGGILTASFTSFNANPKYLVFAEPSTEPIKTIYYFSDDDKGDIGPDGPWAEGVIVGSFRVYITNYPTQTDVLPLQFKVS